MKLLLDIGNSRLKWALSSDTTHFQFGGVLSVNEEVLPFLFADILSQNSIESVWVSNVVGSHYQSVIEEWWMKHAENTPVVFVSSKKTLCGISISYPVPENYGIDRLLSLIAIRQLTTSAFCSIDCLLLMNLALIEIVLEVDTKSLGFSIHEK